VTFGNPLPVWVFLAACGGALVVALAAYWRAPLAAWQRGALSAWRFAVLLLLLLCLMRPMAIDPRDLTGAIVPILVDTSRSMSIEDVDDGRRIDDARAVVSELLPAISMRFTTEVLAFGDGISHVTSDTLSASARRSDVAGALAAVADRYRGRRLAGIVLISDGGHVIPDTGVQPEAPAPVYPIAIGSQTWSRDREVLSVTALDSVLDGSRVDVAVTAVSHGAGADPLELRLLENGRAVDVRRVRPASDGTPVREVFHVTPATNGPTLYTVEIPAVAGDLVPENNARSVLVHGRERPRRVLLVQGAPGYEHSFLRRAWSGDSSLEIDSIVRQGQNERGADTHYIQASAARSGALAGGFPAARADLFAYDAVVLANVGGTLVAGARQQDLRDFVRLRGGGLLVLGAHALQGLVGTALDEVVPLELSGRRPGVVPASAAGAAGRGRVSLTASGEAHPIMQLAASPEQTRARWDALPPLAAVAPLGTTRPGATVLALARRVGGGSWPLVAVQRYGEGRSMVFAGEAAWRWRMRLPASDRTFDMFWRQAIRWLALPAGEPVAIAAPDDPVPGDVVSVAIAARDEVFEPLPAAVGSVRVTAPDGRSEEVAAERDPRDSAAGTLVARYRVDQPGVYRIAAEVRSGGAAPARAVRSILVGGSDPEMTDPALNIDVLQRIAASSGGRVVERGAAADLIDALVAPALDSAVTPGRDIWHSPWVFAAVLVLMAGEWTVRRRWGLL